MGSASASAAQVQLGMPRRSRQVTFSCNKCGTHFALRLKSMCTTTAGQGVFMLLRSRG